MELAKAWGLFSGCSYLHGRRQSGHWDIGTSLRKNQARGWPGGSREGKGRQAGICELHSLSCPWAGILIPTKQTVLFWAEACVAVTG